MKTAQRFYEKVLPAIGFTRETGDEEWGSFTAPGEGKREFFGFTEDPDHRAEWNRISFWADTQEEVDRVAEVVRERGRTGPGRTGSVRGLHAALLRVLF